MPRVPSHAPSSPTQVPARARRAHVVLTSVVVGLLTLAAAAPAGAAPGPVEGIAKVRRVEAPFALVGAANNNPHGDITIACEACHTAAGWRPLREDAEFDHDRQTPFPLTGRHEQANCRSCHLDLRFDAPELAPDDCASCHVDVHRAQLGTDCQTCHTTQDFGLVRGVDVHARTAFPLTGAHLQVACESCHADGGRESDGVFTPVDPSCMSCHADDFQATSTSLVDHVAAGFPTDCQACHSTLSFRAQTTFDHAAQSGGFNLIGAHAALSCASCHAVPGLEPIFDAASQDDCLACHQADHAGAHPSFPTTCATCHTTTTFEGATFDHAAVAGFPLQGAHSVIGCESCHTIPGYEPIFEPASADDCATCHADDHQAVHPTFPTTCTTCHGNTTWAPEGFDHGAVTGFPLLGVHVGLACASCHTIPGFEPIYDPASAQDCATCHADDHQAAHPSFPTTCTTCHQPDTWVGGSFDHQATTGFPLVGVHAALACSNCHTGPEYTPIYDPAGPDDCATCHADEHQANHPSFPTTCTTCHDASTWASPTYDHAANTGFPLAGAHLVIGCESCHTIPDYNPIYTPAGPEDCQTCHSDDHQAAHPAFPTTCLTCHSQESWAGASFDHQAATGFPLVGVHQALACESCHTLPDFIPIYNPQDADDCYACHADDHQANHPSFPTTCATCHQAETWTGGTFDHLAVTGFPLVGVHAPLACASCHTLPDYTPIYSPANADDCYACHADEHQTAHPSFPTTCQTCHQSDTWLGGTFEHGAATGFELIGAHVSLGCESCHVLPDYAPIYNPSSNQDCYACHADDYQAQHAGTGFPTTCTSCHNVDTWAGATFDHDPLFPIYTGSHRGEWDSCQDCHVQPGNFQVFSCITCHEHRQSEMDDEHEDVNGYVYESQACFNCHPDGEDLFPGGSERRRPEFRLVR